MVGPGADGPDDEPVVGRGRLVVPQLSGLAEDENHDIETAIAVEIGDTTAAVGGNRGSHSGPRGGIPESTLSFIGKDGVGLLPTRWIGFAGAIVGLGVRGEDVLPAVVVEIRHRGTPP